ncbi:MAG: hypothetical protein ACM359_06780 [Bacillota bacterium]
MTKDGFNDAICAIPSGIKARPGELVYVPVLTNAVNVMATNIDIGFEAGHLITDIAADLAAAKIAFDPASVNVIKGSAMFGGVWVTPANDTPEEQVPPQKADEWALRGFNPEAAGGTQRCNSVIWSAGATTALGGEITVFRFKVPADAKPGDFIRIWFERCELNEVAVTGYEGSIEIDQPEF